MESSAILMGQGSQVSEKCQSCDPLSNIAHTIQVTRIRVANLCCSGEEQIIRACLENIIGIDQVAVNVVGRYAVVKHCPVSCCASTDRIVNILNEKYLGASIQEVADEMDDFEAEYKLYGNQILHVCAVAALFIVGLVFNFADHANKLSQWIYVASTITGVGPIIYSTGIALFVRHTLDIHVLMLLAIIGAMASGDYFDASLVVTLFLSAELIEQLVMLRVRKAVRMSSAGTIPSHACLVDGANVPAESIQVNMVLAIRAGEMVLADGIVLKGEGVVDESALTGESVPVQKYQGVEVRSGTVVQNGYLEVRVTSASAESTLQKLHQEVLDVQADRGQYAKLVDQFSLYWTPTVLITAIVFVVASGGSTNDWSTALYRGLLLLILACPCAIVIAVPIPAVCAIANAARNGVLIRGSSVVERMGLIDTVALDKTGTLTRGFFKVVNQLVLCEDKTQGPSALAFAAAIEEKSSHPLANAIVSAHFGCIADSDDAALPAVRKVQVLEGVGVSGLVQVGAAWKQCVVGNERMLQSHGGSVRVSPQQEADMLSFARQHANTVCLLVAVDDVLMLMLCLADEIRPESTAFVHKLTSMHLRVAMLTGDTEPVARNVCEEVGIGPTACHFRLLPHQKLEWIRAEQGMDDAADAHEHAPRDVKAASAGRIHAVSSEEIIEAALSEQAAQDQHPSRPQALFRAAEHGVHHNVLMVGDGINDSTALAAAKVGVAMGAGGSAMAVTAASVVLMTENLLMIPAAVRLCQIARSAMIENCTFAIGIKVVAIVLALMGYLRFWHAILIDLGSLLVVVLNGTKLLKCGVFSDLNNTAIASGAVSTSDMALLQRPNSTSPVPSARDDPEAAVMALEMQPTTFHAYTSVSLHVPEDHDCCALEDGGGHDHGHGHAAHNHGGHATAEADCCAHEGGRSRDNVHATHAQPEPMVARKQAVFAAAPVKSQAAHSCCDEDEHSHAGAVHGEGSHSTATHQHGGSCCSPAKAPTPAKACCGGESQEDHHSHHDHAAKSQGPLADSSTPPGTSPASCGTEATTEPLDRATIDHGHSHAHGGTCGSGPSASVRKFQSKLAMLAATPAAAQAQKPNGDN